MNFAELPPTYYIIHPHNNHHQRMFHKAKIIRFHQEKYTRSIICNSPLQHIQKKTRSTSAQEDKHSQDQQVCNQVKYLLHTFLTSILDQKPPADEDIFDIQLGGRSTS